MKNLGKTTLNKDCPDGFYMEIDFCNGYRKFWISEKQGKMENVILYYSIFRGENIVSSKCVLSNITLNRNVAHYKDREIFLLTEREFYNAVSEII